MCASSCVPKISNEQGAFCQGVDAAALLLPPLLLLLPPLLLLMPPRFFLVAPRKKKGSRSKARVLGPAREKAGQGRGSQSTKFGNSTSEGISCKPPQRAPGVHVEEFACRFQ